MDVAEEIRKVRKDKGYSQQEVADKLAISRVQYSRIETGKSDPTMGFLQRIADALEIEMIQFFDAKNGDKEVYAMNEPLLHKVRLLDELEDAQKTAIYNIIDTAIANKRLKQALNNALLI